ncbi:hypothetical protein JTB14_019483 [Gonioctena quinquepunctata]|nr:hypothetical protein JTB14_019483 [Gonioctena quinquepunctata]
MPATAEDRIQDVIDEAANYSNASCSSDEEIALPRYEHVKHNSKPIYAQKKIATFESFPTRRDHEEFIRRCVDILLRDAIFGGTDKKNKVLSYESPEELQRIFDFGLKTLPSTHDDLLELVKDTIQYSVKTGHPYFVNQLFSSLDPYGLVAQWLTDALNPSVYTYEVSPVFTLMEETVLEEMRRIVGYKDGSGDGIFCPGGSLANGYAIQCARHNFMPDIKTKGLHSLPRLVLFTSEKSHYSIKKLSSFLGIGSDNVYAIKTDNRGKIEVPHLRQEIERALREGGVPFMVSATAGTTVMGAFDPIEDIADICDEYKLWLHVDAAWGGGALMSRKYKGLMKGIERADSVTWNPHKLLTAPQQCSTLLLRHEGILAAANSTHAAYLFQKDKFYDTKYDTGDKHIQCGRRADVLKFWFMWKAKGTSGFEKHVDKVFENAEYFLDNIKYRSDFELVVEKPEFTNICFWYIPPSLRNADKTHPDYKEKLHKIAPKIKEKMMKEGSMMVTYQAENEYPNFFRIVFQNSGLEKSDMIHLINEFERLGSDL